MGAGYSLQLENKSTELGMPAIQQGYLDGLRGGTNLDHTTVVCLGSIPSVLETGQSLVAPVGDRYPL